MKKIRTGLLRAFVFALCISSMAIQALAAVTVTTSGTKIKLTDTDDSAVSYEMTCTYAQTIIPISSSSSQSISGGKSSVTWDELSKFTLSATNSKYYNYYLTKGDAQNYKATLTIKNTSGSTLNLSYKTDGIDNVSDGTYTLKLANNESYSFSITTDVASNYSKNTAVTGSVTIESVTSLSGAKLIFDSASHGDYSYQIGENEVINVSAGEAKSDEISVGVGSKISLTQGTPADGYQFYGWMGNGKLLGTEDGAYEVTDSMTVYPVFLPTDIVEMGAPFKVGNNYHMFWHLAFADAKLTGNTVVLVKDCVLPAKLEDTGLREGHGYSGYVTGEDGEIKYVVPIGVKFLVPYSANDPDCFRIEAQNFTIDEAGVCTLIDDGTRNSAYSTLVVSSGAAIDCYGSINVNGQRQKDGQPYTGVTAGSYGKIVLGTEPEDLDIYSLPTIESLEEQLIIRSGGSLYCYGYITGFGLVVLEGGVDSSGNEVGGSLYELMQICDWPGGGDALDWAAAAKKSETTPHFVLSQYYVQNVESPLKIECGATTYVEAVLTASGQSVATSSAYIGTKEGVFQLESGAYAYRIYDVKEDRMNYHLYGTNILGAISICKEVYLGNTAIKLATIDLNSTNYVLPLSSNLSVAVEKDAILKLNQKIALLPGSEVVVAEGGTVNLDGGQVYIWDVNDWSGSYFFDRADMKLDLAEGETAADYRKYSKGSEINCAPLPYVATLDSVSPRATSFGIVRGYTANSDGSNRAERYYVDPEKIAVSGKLKVDGTLNITNGGLLCATDISTSKEAADKVIVGTGVINYSSNPETGSLGTGHGATITKRTTTYGLANLAGVGTLKPFASGTYYGQSNGYWYNYLVKAADADTAAKFTPGNTKLVDSTVSRYNGTETEEIPNVLGLVSNYLKDGVSTGSTFTFSVAPTTTPAATNGVFSLLSVAENPVDYGLSKVTADVTLSVSSVGTSTDITTVASNANYADIFTTETQLPDGIDVSGFFSDRECTSAASSIGGTLYTPTEAFAAIGPSKGNYAFAYMKISDAVNAADDTNNYVTVLQNRTLTDAIVVDADQNITLDLGGKTLTGNVATVFNGATGQKLVTNNGTMCLLNGTITFNGAHTTTDYADANFAATVYNLGTIEYIEDVILQETAGNIYNAALLNGAGGIIKEIRSGTLKGNSYSAGTAIHNRGTIQTIGTSGGTVEIIGRRGIALRGNGRIDTIGGEGSTIVLESSQRGINTHASTASVGTIGESGSTVNITMKSSGMGRTAIFGEDSGVFEVIGGKGSTLNITVEEGTIYTQTAIRVTRAPADGVVVIGDTGSTINITVVNNVAADAKDPGQVIGINSSTTTKIGASGSSMNINVNQKGKGTAYGIYNNGTIKSLGATDASIEIVSNYDGIYNASSKTINSISGDVVVVSTDTTGKYYGLCNQGTITTINSGDFYHANGRGNAVLNPDSQNYPTDRHGLSKDTRKVTLSDGTTTYDCYYVTVVDPAAGTVKGEDVIDQYVTLADAVEEYLALEDKNGVYVVLYDDCAETSGISLDKDIYLDLNGHTVTLAEDGLTVGNNVTLYGMDSKTNAYLTDGSIPGQIVGTISGKIDAVHSIEDGANAGKHYAVVTKTVDGKNVTQFHRVGVSVSAYRFFVSSTDITGGYLSVEGTFRSTRDGFDAMDKLGFVGVSETIARDALVESVAEDGTVTLWKDSYAKGDRIPIHYTFATGLNTENKIGMVAMYDSDSAESAMRTLVLKEVLEDYCSALNAEEDADLIAKINSYLRT